jgi:enoyl-CoA hydratase/carnithine racemase
MSFDNLLLEPDGAVAVLSINRPKVLHAFETQTIGELRDFLAQKLAAKAPVAVEYTLESVQHGGAMPLDRVLRMDATLVGLAPSTDDTRVGTAVFLEKQQARVAGR